MADIDVYKDWLGVPEDAGRPPDHYSLLRAVKFEDDAEKVRSNYKKLNAHVRKYATGQYSVISQQLLNEMAKAMLLLTDAERKREYDASLGREFDDDEDGGRRTVAQFLVDRGAISREQVNEIEDFANARGLSMRDAVVQMKLVDAELATQAYAQELGLPFVDLADMLPDDSVLDQVPKGIVKRHSCLPLFVDDDMLLVACADEPDQDLEDDLRMRFEMPMRAVMAVPLTINQAIAKYYAPGARDEVTTEGAANGAKTKAGGKKSGRAAAKQKSASAQKSMKQLTPDEQRERKMIGIIIMLWAVVGSSLIDHFLIRSMFSWSYSALTLLLVAPLAILFVTKVYWK